MCAGALVLARVARVVFGAWDPKAGAAARCGTSCATAGRPTAPEVVGGVREQECSRLLLDFFAGQRSWTGGALTGPISVSPPPLVASPAVACPSGLRSTPRKRVRG